MWFEILPVYLIILIIIFNNYYRVDGSENIHNEKYEEEIDDRDREGIEHSEK